jgi:hypothetical protein
MCHIRKKQYCTAVAQKSGNVRRILCPLAGLLCLGLKIALFLLDNSMISITSLSSSVVFVSNKIRYLFRPLSTKNTNQPTNKQTKLTKKPSSRYLQSFYSTRCIYLIQVAATPEKEVLVVITSAGSYLHI